MSLILQPLLTLICSTQDTVTPLRNPMLYNLFSGRLFHILDNRIRFPTLTCFVNNGQRVGQPIRAGAHFWTDLQLCSNTTLGGHKGAIFNVACAKRSLVYCSHSRPPVKRFCFIVVYIVEIAHLAHR